MRSTVLFKRDFGIDSHSVDQLAVARALAGSIVRMNPIIGLDASMMISSLKKHSAKHQAIGTSLTVYYDLKRF